MKEVDGQTGKSRCELTTEQVRALWREVANSHDGAADMKLFSDGTVQGEKIRCTWDIFLASRAGGVKEMKLTLQGAQGLNAAFWVERIQDSLGAYFNVYHRVVNEGASEPTRRKGIGGFMLASIEEALRVLAEKNARGRVITIGAAGSQPSAIHFFRSQGYDFLYEKDRELFSKLTVEIAASVSESPMETVSFVRVCPELQGDGVTRDFAYIEKGKTHEDGRVVQAGDIVDFGSNFQQMLIGARNADKPHALFPDFFVQKVIPLS